MRKSGLPPVADERSQILILGTLPSDKSLAAGQYYANRNNDFWKLVGTALNENLERLPYETKIEILKAHGVGLWDAFHTCVRPGSMDKDITEQELNDFEVLKKFTPKLRLVCFNGQGAAAAEERLHRLGYKTHLLPSSSSVNRKDQHGRAECWKTVLG